MGRSRKEIIEQFPRMKEMYDSGCHVDEIAKSFNVSRNSVYNSFNIMGLSLKKKLIDEEKLVYAVNKPPILETMTINGKHYTDITPLFSRR